MYTDRNLSGDAFPHGLAEQLHLADHQRNWGVPSFFDHPQWASTPHLANTRRAPQPPANQATHPTGDATRPPSNSCPKAASTRAADASKDAGRRATHLRQVDEAGAEGRPYSCAWLGSAGGACTGSRDMPQEAQTTPERPEQREPYPDHLEDVWWVALLTEKVGWPARSVSKRPHGLAESKPQERGFNTWSTAMTW